MFKTGIKRIVDNKGRLTIPKLICDVYKLNDTHVEFFVENELIIIKQVNNDEVDIQKEKQTKNFDEVYSWSIF